MNVADDEEWDNEPVHDSLCVLHRWKEIWYAYCVIV